MAERSVPSSFSNYLTSNKSRSDPDFQINGQNNSCNFKYLSHELLYIQSFIQLSNNFFHIETRTEEGNLCTIFNFAFLLSVSFHACLLTKPEIAHHVE